MKMSTVTMYSQVAAPALISNLQCTEYSSLRTWFQTCSYGKILWYNVHVHVQCISIYLVNTCTYMYMYLHMNNDGLAFHTENCNFSLFFFIYVSAVLISTFASSKKHVHVVCQRVSSIRAPPFPSLHSNHAQPTYNRSCCNQK